MFGILMKHEIRQTIKPLATIVGASALIVVAGAVPVYLKIPVVSGIGLAVSLVAPVAMPWAALIYLLVSYYQTMYGRVGYFTMSLPVRGRCLYLAKTLWAFLVGMFCYALMLLSLVWSASLSGEAAVRGGISSLVDEIGWLGISVLVLLLVSALPALIAQGAFVVTYGMENRFARFGLGGPVIVGVVVYVVNQITILAALLAIPVGVRFLPGGNAEIVGEGTWASMVRALEGDTSAPPVIGLGVVIVYLALAVIASVWAARSIERHTCLR